MPSPDYGELAFAGNVFALTGYRYQGFKTSRLTGDIQEVPSTRFDVLAWRVEPPYWALYRDEQTGNYSVREQLSEPTGHEMGHGDHAPANFKMQKYHTCP